MNIMFKSARDWLIQSSRRSFYEIIHEAKITPRQMEIIEMRFVKGLMNYQIAMRLNISTPTVEREISAAYAAINRILLKGMN